MSESPVEHSPNNFEAQAVSAIALAKNMGYNFIYVSNRQLTLLKNRVVDLREIVPLDSAQARIMIADAIEQRGGIENPTDIFTVELPPKTLEQPTA